MLLEGTAEFPYDVAYVWAVLHDIDVLTKVIPGCKSMVPCGDDEYVVALALGVAAIKGDYEGRVRVTDVAYPHQYVLEAEGAGGPGFVKLRMDCRLEQQENGTLMRWACDVTVGGLIASIGGRVLSGISKFMAKQFFKALKGEMESLITSKAALSTEGM